MGLPKLKLPRANADRAYKDEPDPRPSDAVLRQSANGDDGLVDTKIPFLTFRSFSMCVVISMGGFLFGYDTGQISGFLEMEDFLQRYGEQRADGTYYFSNVRSGLIVALVRIVPDSFYISYPAKLTIAVNWHLNGRIGGRADCGSGWSQMVCQRVVCDSLRRDHGPDLFSDRQVVSSCVGSMGCWSWCGSLIPPGPHVSSRDWPQTYSRILSQVDIIPERMTRICF